MVPFNPNDPSFLREPITTPNQGSRFAQDLSTRKFFGKLPKQDIEKALWLVLSVTSGYPRRHNGLTQVNHALKIAWNLQEIVHETSPEVFIVALLHEYPVAAGKGWDKKLIEKFGVIRGAEIVTLLNQISSAPASGNWYERKKAQQNTWQQNIKQRNVLAAMVMHEATNLQETLLLAEENANHWEKYGASNPHDFVQAYQKTYDVFYELLKQYNKKGTDEPLANVFNFLKKQIEWGKQLALASVMA